MVEKPEQKANEFCGDNCLEKRIEKLERQPIGLNYLFKSIVSFAVAILIQDLFIILTEYHGHEIPENLVQLKALVSLFAIIPAVVYGLLAITTFVFDTIEIVKALIKFIKDVHLKS